MGRRKREAAPARIVFCRVCRPIVQLWGQIAGVLGTRRSQKMDRRGRFAADEPKSDRLLAAGQPVDQAWPGQGSTFAPTAQTLGSLVFRSLNSASALEDARPVFVAPRHEMEGDRVHGQQPRCRDCDRVGQRTAALNPLRYGACWRTSDLGERLLPVQTAPQALEDTMHGVARRVARAIRRDRYKLGRIG